MPERTPWDDLYDGLNFDHATAVLNAMLALNRLGETAEDIERWLIRNWWT